MTEHVAWLTQEAYDQAKAELEQLTTTGRSEIAKRIEAARAEGDLSENGGYHAAKEEQGKQEARIRALQDLLHRAVVGQQPPAVGIARAWPSRSPSACRRGVISVPVRWPTTRPLAVACTHSSLPWPGSATTTGACFSVPRRRSTATTSPRGAPAAA